MRSPGSELLSNMLGRTLVALGPIFALVIGVLSQVRVRLRVGTLQSYFEAIDRGEYVRAYTYWNYLGKASQRNFAQFHSEFAAIEHVIVDVGEPEIGGAAGSVYAEVPAAIVMTQSDQTTRTFCGTYTLRRANVPPFDQLGWRIERAEVAPTTVVQPGSTEAKRLLSGGCAPAPTPAPQPDTSPDTSIEYR